jgi:cystathionine beta-lyase
MTYDFDSVFDRTSTESSKWHRYPPDVIPMFVADMDFRSADVIVNALQDRVAHGFFGYGQEQPQFFEVVASRIHRRYGWDVAPDSIVLFPGVINGFNLAVRALTRPAQSVLMHTPTYGPIMHCPENHGLSRDEAALVQDADGRYQVDWEAFEAAIKPSTRIFLLCNPHNPTGRVFNRAELERMAAVSAAHDLTIISDEIHCDLVYPEAVHTPIASIDPEIAARTITFMAPSKTFNLPGLKCAVAVIPNADLRARVAGERHGLVSGVNILGYTAALAAYRDGDAWLAAAIQYLDGNRRLVADFVRDHLPSIRFCPPEGTYLGWLDCRALPVEEPAAFFLENARVGLSAGSQFGPTVRQFVRLNFACPRPLLTEGLQRMQRAVKALNA